MESIQLLVSVPGQAEPILMTVPQGARIVEVIEIVRGQGEAGLHDAEEVFLFLADQDEALGAEKRLDECGGGHRHHVHAHHCRAVEVNVAFGDVQKSRLFAPSARVGKVKDWAVEAFAAPTETADYSLGEGQKRLDDDTHLCALTHHCHLRLDLIAQGLTIHYTVNAEPQVAHERHRTPRMILAQADLDASKYFLKNAAQSFKGTPDQPILLHEGEVFTAIYAGGGTVS